MGKIVSIRKNLNISVENERRIQGLRSMTLGLDPAVDLDYTQATNMLIELGFKFLEQIGHMTSGPKIPASVEPMVPAEEAFEIFGNYLGNAVVASYDQEDRIRWSNEFTKRKPSMNLLNSLASLSTFQPRQTEKMRDEASGKR